MLVINNKDILKAVGKRKTAVAKAFLKRGSGRILINNKNFDTFFSNFYEEKNKIIVPLIITNFNNTYDATIYVKGGGIRSQLGAIQLAIAKAISSINVELKTTLKRNTLLKRDARIKERRKYGLKKARKAPQYSKR